MSNEPCPAAAEPESTDHAVDGFTWEEVEAFALDSVVPARCTECKADRLVEPDAENLSCEECDAENSVTSPLRKLGLI